MQEIIKEFTRGVDIEKMAKEIERLRKENSSLRVQLNGKAKPVRSRRRVTREHRELWLRMKSEGFPVSQIAARTGHGASTVSNFFHEYYKNR